MRLTKVLAVVGALALLAATGLVAQAHYYYGRQYYGGWTYYPSYSYYYCNYNYQPYDGYDGYQHHYCIYYPSQPRYVYYYNPYQHYYWGRLDMQAKGDAKYSLLAEKDRKGSLKDIPDSAFPEPAKMPAIPGSKDGVAIKPLSTDELPKGKTPGDLPEK